jgi:phage baseplate assembly protein W
MPIKDFSILLEKISSTTTKKDVGLVSGFNAYAQYIEVVCKTQKGELVSNMNLGSNYFSYIFSGQADLPAMQTSMAAYIQSAIPHIYNVRVFTQYTSQTMFQFMIIYSVSDGLSSQMNSTTFVEVEI